MRLLLIFGLLFLVSVQPWLVTGLPNIPELALRIARFQWEELFRDQISTNKLSAEDHVLVKEPADPEVGVLQISHDTTYNPFDQPKLLFGIEDPTKISIAPALTGDMIFYDEINNHRGGFEVDNSKKHYNILVLITTKGLWVTKFSTRFEDNVLEMRSKQTADKAGKSQFYKERTLQDFEGMKSFRWWVNWLIMGERSNEQQPKKTEKTAQAAATLNRFLDKLESEEKGGKPLHLLAITQPSSAPLSQRNPWVFNAIVEKVQKNVKSAFAAQLKPQKIAMDMTGPDIVNKFGIYTYRNDFIREVDGKWRKLEAQFVTAIYGNKGGMSMMIPLGSEENHEGRDDPGDPMDIDNRECGEDSEEDEFEAHDLQGGDEKKIGLSPTKPIARMIQWKDTPESWFDSLLEPTRKKARPNAFVVLATDGYWLLSVPRAYVNAKDMRHQGWTSTSNDAWIHGNQAFNALVSRFVSEKYENSLDTFLKPDKTVFGYVMLGGDDTKEGVPLNAGFFGAMWTRIDRKVRKKTGISLDKVHYFAAGESLDQSLDRNHFIVSVSEAAKKGSIIYQNEPKISIDLESASHEPTITDDKGGSQSFTLAELKDWGEGFV